MNIGRNSRVTVTGTDIIGEIAQIGCNGMVRIDILTEHSAFDRLVYHYTELEKVN